MLTFIVPIEKQRDEESQTTDQKKDAAGKAENVIALQALYDEEDGTHQEKEPTHQVESFFLLVYV